MNKLEIEKVENGYIVTRADEPCHRYVWPTLTEALQDIAESILCSYGFVKVTVKVLSAEEGVA